MTGYVLGFLFTPDFKRVALLRKTHGPGEMAGKLNGIGGHVESGEMPIEAMNREAKEELGVETDWMAFCSMRSDDEWICDCFVADIESFRDLPLANDAGEVVEIHVPEIVLLSVDIMLNLKWLIPLAMESSASGVMSEVHYPIGARGDR